MNFVFERGIGLYSYLVLCPLTAAVLLGRAGYRELFRDRSATHVVSGALGLATQPCENICMRKYIASEVATATDKSSLVEWISGMLGVRLKLH